MAHRPKELPRLLLINYMYKGFKIIAVIPARGGSKGIPRKNIKLLAGKPLIAYSIEAGQSSSYLDRVFVSTEDEEIAFIAKQLRSEVTKRPLELAGDETPMLPVLNHLLCELEKKEKFKPDILVILQPTSPLRQAWHIDQAIKHFFSGDFDSLLGVSLIYEHRFELIKDSCYITPVLQERKNRQERLPVMVENGFIYVIKVDVIKAGRILGDRIAHYPVEKKYAIDIDDYDDFLIAEKIIKNQ